jgi:hypothetical protein
LFHKEISRHTITFYLNLFQIPVAL